MMHRVIQIAASLSLPILLGSCASNEAPAPEPDPAPGLYSDTMQVDGLLAAIAPVAGSDCSETDSISRHISLLYITGTVDPLNPLYGGDISIGGIHYGTKPPVADMIRRWVRMLDCGMDSTVIRDDNGVRGLSYGPCSHGAEVQFYTVNDVGHTWPGGLSLLPGSLVGPNSDKLKANDVIWDFFSRHALP